jgi:hypothetical protein|nr:MAG TPA: hypothetical protein [Caudoviricetes sp.]
MHPLFKVLIGLATLGTVLGVVSANLEKQAKKAEAELDAIVEQITDMAVDASMEYVDEEYADLCEDWKEEN